jgi:hypothetical protein
MATAIINLYSKSFFGVSEIGFSEEVDLVGHGLVLRIILYLV